MSGVVASITDDGRYEVRLMVEKSSLPGWTE